VWLMCFQILNPSLNLELVLFHLGILCSILTSTVQTADGKIDGDICQ
jgi:hypothetical protein